MWIPQLLPRNQSRGTVGVCPSRRQIEVAAGFENVMIQAFTRDLRSFVRSHYQVLILVFLWAIVLATYAFARHERLNSSAYDLAIKTQVIWNTFQGDWFASSIEVEHYLGDHVQIIFLLLAPLYALWADVRVMLLLQAFLLSLAAIPVYRIALRRLADRWLALLFAAAYLLFPLVGFVNRFDFHPLVFTIPLFFLAYDLLDTDHLTWASLFIFLSLTLREDVGFTVFAFGLYAAVFMKRRTLGLIWAVAGLSWSLTAIFVVIPYFRGGVSDTMGRYAWLGDSPPGMLRTLLTESLLVMDHLLQPYRRTLLLKLLLPLGFLSLLSPAPLLVGLPALAYNLLSETPSQSSIYFQYLAPVVPFIFIAAIQGAARVQKWLANEWSRWALIAWIGLGMTLAWVWDNPFTRTIESPYFPVYSLERVADREAFDQARALLPPDAPVATMMAYAPHLALRPELHLFYDRLRLQERPYGFPQTDYLLLNLTDMRWGVNARFFYSAIETAIGRYGYEALVAGEDVILLHKTNEPQPLTGAVLGRVIELLESGGKYAPAAQETIDWMGRQWILDQLPPEIVPQPLQFEQGITLLGFEAEMERTAGQPLCVTLYWQASSAIDQDFTAFLHLVAPDGFLQAQRDSSPAFGFYPTSQWQPGQIVADMHCLQLPSGLAPGQYDLQAGLYDPDTSQRLAIVDDSANEDSAAPLGQISVVSPHRNFARQGQSGYDTNLEAMDIIPLPKGST